MTKKRFNMIEVVLALGITAIGIVGILAVFPVGLKTANKAIAESYVADLANGFLDNLEAEGKTWLNDIPVKEDKPVPEEGTSPEVLVYPTIKTNQDFSRDPNGPYKDMGSNIGNRRIYQIVGSVPEKEECDFSKDLPCQIDMAIDRISWQEYPMILNSKGVLVKQEDQLYENKKMTRVYVEYSWPVSVPYADREKRLFVREYLLE